MRSVLSAILIVLTGQAIFLGIGIGEGFLIHWAIPAIGLDSAILAAILTMLMVGYIFINVFNSMARLRQATVEEDTLETDDDENDDDHDDEEDDDFDQLEERALAEFKRLLRQQATAAGHRPRRRR